MNKLKSKHPKGGLRLLITVVILYIIGVVMVYSLRLVFNDILSVAALMSTAALISITIGYLLQRFGIWRMLPSVRQALILGDMLAGGLTILAVWITARLMFINERDMIITTVLVSAAALIAVALGSFVSGSLTHTLAQVVRGAEQFGNGDLSVRVDVSGRDEMSRLALTFNAMAGRLQQANDERESLEETRRQLVAGASHDLRTPLAALRAMLDAIVDGIVDDSETHDRYLRQCQNEIKHMSILIDDLFELAQLDAQPVLHCETASLSDLVSDTLAAFTARAKAQGVDLSGEVAEDVDPVWMAPDKISRVLYNLLENALRHTPEGGLIRVDVERKGDIIRIQIADSGEGIAAEDLPHIFDRFYRGEKSRTRDGSAGTSAGLGLAITHRLVEAHGGSIRAEETPGGGATMVIVLPREESR